VKTLKNNNKMILLSAVITAFIFGVFVSNISILFNDHEEDEEHSEMHEDKHDEHAEEGLVLSLKEIKEFGITTGRVRKGSLLQKIKLSGEVSYNENQLAHIVPRVEGVISQVNFNLGDLVKKGDVLAVIESRELADAKASYLESLERNRLAKVRFDREKNLWEKKISSEQDYLDATLLKEEARIQLLTTEQKLLALGVSREALASIDNGKEQDFTSYKITSPIKGTVVEKHIVLGERAQTDSNLFTIADLSYLWVNLTLYPKDIAHLAKKQTAFIKSNSSNIQTEGLVEYISPFLEESTRSATTRVVIENKKEKWRPGMFVTADIAIAEFDVEKRIPLSAIQVMDGKNIVFVRHKEGFEPSAITTGRSDGKFIEVIQGLEDGDEYVTDNSFVLKAEINKSSFGDGHGH
jgi:cobalt-zinc-cadmium efflux system membrane fusion protein